jgi:hypothetical protein
MKSSAKPGWVLLGAAVLVGAVIAVAGIRPWHRAAFE